MFFFLKKIHLFVVFEKVGGKISSSKLAVSRNIVLFERNTCYLMAIYLGVK